MSYTKASSVAERSRVPLPPPPPPPLQADSTAAQARTRKLETALILRVDCMRVPPEKSSAGSRPPTGTEPSLGPARETGQGAMSGFERFPGCNEGIRQA